MTGIVVAFVLAAGPWPTLERAFEARPLAVIEVPDASDLMARTERSYFKRWVPTLMGRDAKTIRESSMRVIGAWYGSLAGQDPDVALAVDVQRNIDTVDSMVVGWWERLGFKAGGTEPVGAVVRLSRGSQAVSVARHTDKRRVGWAVANKRANAFATGWPKPLAADEAFLGMVSAAPRSDFRGVLHMPRVFGWLLNQPNGQATARLISRMGLDGVQMSTFSGRLVHRREARLEGQTRISGPRRGILEAIGPDVANEWPISVPADASGFAAVSVLPAAVLRAAYNYLAADNPLQFTLVQAQISALENKIGKNLGSDVLGEAPQTWVIYKDRRGQWLWVLTMKEPDAIRSLLEALAAAYPSLKVTETKVASVPAVRFGAACAAFPGGAVVFGESEEAVRRHLRQPALESPPTLVERGKGFAFGQGKAVLGGIARAAGYPVPDTSDTVGFRLSRDGEEYSLHGRLRR